MAMGFAGAMSNYPHPVNDIDAFASATPLAVAGQVGSDSYLTLLVGNHGGVLGETCAITILVGGLFLIATKVISPTIPVTYLATVAVLSLAAGQDPIYQLLSGGLLLGAFFMATDYVTSPTTTKGKLIFGLGLGIITCGIRFLGTMAEGVSFSILLMNLTVPTSRSSLVRTAWASPKLRRTRRVPGNEQLESYWETHCGAFFDLRHRHRRSGRHQRGDRPHY